MNSWREKSATFTGRSFKATTLKDFTLRTLKVLYLELIRNGYTLACYKQYAEGGLRQNRKWAVIRHDVDARPQFAVNMASLEYQLGIATTYYFRSHPALPVEPIKRVADLGHEIGFHYESFARQNGNQEKAILDFAKGLQQIRTHAPVSTIAMHGSPLSRHNNLHLWQYFDYHDFDVQAEVYLDTDFQSIAYFTDTGRAWNSPVNLRDKPSPWKQQPVPSTFHFISAITNGEMPSKMILNIHPQRWSDSWRHWHLERYGQRFRNTFKRILLLQQKVWKQQ